MADPPITPPDPATDFTEFSLNLNSHTMSLIRSTNALAAQDIDFQRTSSPAFSTAVDATSARILTLVNTLLATCATGPPTLTDTDDVENKWSAIVDVADSLLEKADTCLDEYTGAIRKQVTSPPSRTFAKVTVGNDGIVGAGGSRGKNFTAKSWASRTMTKPQLGFSDRPDNNAQGPWRPLLRSKPHASVKSLEESLELVSTATNSDMEVDSEEGAPVERKARGKAPLWMEQYAHPYAAEIGALEKYPAHVYETREPEEYRDFETTTAIWVDTVEGVNAMLEQLRGEKEIAVDLEHHDTRSYIGFVCLIQISTRTQDWIVDTLKLRAAELQVLNEVFADPQIVKVLHGAYMDVVWLQRDFGIYVVGLFDTFYASRALGFQGHGLAFLLKKYVNFDADKQYQLADWRLRPLPEEMFNYARSDTHFLLYIYDNLRNSLLLKSGANTRNPDDDKMGYVLRHSSEIALRQYECEPYNFATGEGPIGWATMLGRSNESLDMQQLAVFKVVHQWRDTTARIEDESHHYVMPRHHIFNLARKMPTNLADVLACCHPASSPVRARAGELVVAIRKAKESPEVKAWKEEVAANAAAATVEKDAAPTHVRFDKTHPEVNIFSTATVKGEDFNRAPDSGFWGTSAGTSSRWTCAANGGEGVSKDNDDEVQLALLLPHLTAEVFVHPDDGINSKTETKAVDPGARAEHEYIKNRPEKEKDDSVMIVRTAGGAVPRKRKIEAAQTPEAESDHDEADGDAEEKEKEKIENKRKRRKEKKEKKKATAAAAEKEIKPFDYATAPSILNGLKEDRTRKKDKRDKKKKGKDSAEFDPYADAEKNGIRPARVSQGQRERAGRSHTFKN